jgi:glutamate dehydrogenase
MTAITRWSSRPGWDWRDIAMMRAYSRYLRQARIPYSQDYMWQTLNRHPGIAAAIVELFHARSALTSGPGRRAKDERRSWSRIDGGATRPFPAWTRTAS